MTLHLSQPLALITHSVRAAKQDIQRGVYRENKQKANKSQKCGDILRRVALEWLETSDIELRYPHTTAPKSMAHLDQAGVRRGSFVARNGLEDGGCSIVVPFRDLEEKRLHTFAPTDV